MADYGGSPDDPFGINSIDPAVADALAKSREPYDWVPDSWRQDVAVPEYGMPSMPVTTTPPESARPAAQISGATSKVIDEAAAPALNGIDPNLIEIEDEPAVKIGEPKPASVQGILGEISTPGMDQQGTESLQPGIGIPSSYLDNAPMPPIDALSGVPGETSYFNSGVADILGPPTSIDKQRGPLTEDEQFRQTYEQLLKSDPHKAAEFIEAHQARAEAEKARRLAEETLNDEKIAQQNLDTHRRAVGEARAERVKLRAEAVALANQKIDDKHWWGSRSTGQKMAIFVGALVSGLVSGRTGKPDDFMSWVGGEIERDIKTQKANLDHKREMLGIKRQDVADQLADANADFVFEEKARQAGWERMKLNLAAEAEKYDRAGTRAIRLYGMITQIDQAQAKSADDFEKNQLERKIKIEDLLSKRLANQKAMGTLGGAGVGGTKADDEVRLPSYYKDRGLVPPPVGMSIKDYEKWQKQKKGSDEITKSAREEEEKLSERQVGQPGEFTQKDGKTEWIAPDSKEGTKFRKQKGALDALAQMRNEIARGIAAHGGESEFFRSADWQRQTSRHTFIQGLVKEALELGALDKGSQQFAKDLAGDVDPTSFWRDARPGLDQLVDNLTAKFNHDMGAARYTGKPYRPPNASKLPPPTVEAVDKAYLTAKKSEYGRTIAEGDPSGFDPVDSLIEYGATGGQGPAYVGIKRDYNSAKDERPTKEALDALYRAATAGKPDEQKKAIAYLKSLTEESGPTDTVKDLAAQYYQAALVHQGTRPPPAPKKETK